MFDGRFRTALDKGVRPIGSGIRRVGITADHLNWPATCRGFLDLYPDGSMLGQRVQPLARVGVYVPGGRAAYPSSVLMNAVPAKVAGVKEVIMVVPTPSGVPFAMLLRKMSPVEIVGTAKFSEIRAACVYTCINYPARSF